MQSLAGLSSKDTSEEHGKQSPSKSEEENRGFRDIGLI